jgi:hypothetical protein
MKTALKQSGLFAEIEGLNEAIFLSEMTRKAWLISFIGSIAGAVAGMKTTRNIQTRPVRWG